MAQIAECFLLPGHNFMPHEQLHIIDDCLDIKYQDSYKYNSWSRHFRLSWPGSYCSSYSVSNLRVDHLRNCTSDILRCLPAWHCPSSSPLHRISVVPGSLTSELKRPSPRTSSHCTVSLFSISRYYNNPRQPCRLQNIPGPESDVPSLRQHHSPVRKWQDIYSHCILLALIGAWLCHLIVNNYWANHYLIYIF